jgi:hypothetical protein
MDIIEAKEATQNGPVIVETKSGAQYRIYNNQVCARDDDDDGYIYGERVNAAPRSRFKRGRGAENGDTRWFYLKSVKLAILIM